MFEITFYFHLLKKKIKKKNLNSVYFSYIYLIHFEREFLKCLGS